MVQNNPLISIVLPCYNGEKYLAKSIQSCIDQDYLNWELILVDDCSIDGTFKIMQQFAQKDCRICIIQNKVNLKLPRSLNTGFAEAHGEYFTWTSDDNFYFKTALRELLQTLLINNADVVYSGHYIIDDEDRFTGKVSPVNPETLIYANYTKACFLYKRIVHESLHGYNADMFLVEDYDFWLRAYLANYQIVTTNKLLYAYREHKNSLTVLRQKDIRRAVYKMHINNRGNLEKFPLYCRKNYWYFILRNMNFGKKDDLLFFVKNINHILNPIIILNTIWRVLKILFLKSKNMLSKNNIQS